MVQDVFLTLRISSPEILLNEGMKYIRVIYTKEAFNIFYVEKINSGQPLTARCVVQEVFYLDTAN